MMQCWVSCFLLKLHPVKRVCGPTENHSPTSLRRKTSADFGQIMRSLFAWRRNKTLSGSKILSGIFTEPCVKSYWFNMHGLDVSSLDWCIFFYIMSVANCCLISVLFRALWFEPELVWLHCQKAQFQNTIQIHQKSNALMLSSTQSCRNSRNVHSLTSNTHLKKPKQTKKTNELKIEKKHIIKDVAWFP